MSVRASRWCALLVAGAWVAGFSAGAVAEARAQRAPAGEAGGRTASLGQPRLWRWEVGLGAGAFLAGPSNDLMVRATGGGYHPSLNPVTKLAELGLEAYLGARGTKADGGVRGILQVPYLSAGIGADYNLRGGRLDMLLTMHTPVRRGGLLTRGTLLRVDWYPTLKHSFTVGVSAPLGDPLAGRNRPIQDYVVVAGDFNRPESHRADPTLEADLDSLRISAGWIRKLVVPFMDQDGRSSAVALARTTKYVTALKTHLAVRSAEAEVRFFHAQLEHAFTVASGSATAGRDLARRCRQILLDEVLLPYDGLLGRKKRHDTLKALSVAGRGRFGRWVATSGSVPTDRLEAVLFVFQRVTEILEDLRREAAIEWDDPRLVWLPLQYALLPEEHDEQVELDALLERVTGATFSDHNRLAYVANLQFHWELLRMIQETRRYHVLWIHDFPALSPEGTLDDAALAQVADGYLATLADRVEAYDSTGTLPQFFIFLDQHYYEGRKSRILMTVLEDPLHASAQLRGATAAHTERLTRALARLRGAVERSHVLQAEAREYGDAWLRNSIKVHVNITNRVDASFWSGGLVSSVFGYPDDVMRDHRKIAFRDVTEDDPFAGAGILTGMGVGQHYLGPGWDDRSLVMQGPVLLQLKDAARELLLSQGVAPTEIPLPLRSPRWGAAVRGMPAPPDGTRFGTRAIALFNETGYLSKSLNAAKALLYSLMPAGSVIKIPDSLWNSTFYGALLAGACVRGAQVLIIAPAEANAASRGFPQMARAHELLTRLLVVRDELGTAITASGGALHIGLYALPVDRRGFASRADLWAHQVGTTPFLQALMPFAPAVLPAVTDASRREPEGASATAASPPKLHQKVQFLATGEFWRAVTASAEWPRFMTMYLRYRDATYSPGDESAGVRALPDSLRQIAERLIGPAHDTPRAASFALVGSQNQDYRGMFMDGEVGVVFTGAESLVPLIDLVFMVGTVTWVDNQAALDRLIPPVGELQRRIARVTKDGV